MVGTRARPLLARTGAGAAAVVQITRRSCLAIACACAGRYDTTGRRAQAKANRERILRVATRLFCAQGYAATSIAQIAEEAGVSAPTVFAAGKSKVSLLKEAIDIAIVGDTRAMPLAERPQMRHVHEAATALSMSAAGARGLPRPV